MPDKCKWCGMPKNDHIEAWSCGSFPGWDETKPIQSIACVEIARLKAGNEKLVRVAEVADDIKYTYIEKGDKDLEGNFIIPKEYLDNLCKALKDLEAPDENLP